MSAAAGDPMSESADDWDEHWTDLSVSAENNPAQRFRHRLVTDMVARATPRVFLDIGSGQGDLLQMIAASDVRCDLVGLELSSVGVALTLEKVGPRARVLQVNLLDDEAGRLLADINADVAVCCEVLEHLDEPELFLRAARSALAPGATLIVTVPSGPRSSFDKLIGHRRHYSQKDLRQLLECSGFRVEETFGAGFPFFNLYRLVVVARGSKLADDVRGEKVSKLATFVMKVFGVLLKFNLPKSRWGLQIVAVATAPSATVAAQ